jgi:site-specific DNA-methyltransferase (adenine-specific)
MDLSTNVVYNEDCLQVLPRIPDKSIDMILVDLPYGQTSCEWDIKIDLTEMWKQLKRICKDNAAMCFFTTTKFGVELINSNPKWFRYDLVMPKNRKVGFLHAKKFPLRGHEMIYVFYKKCPVYHPQKTEGEPYTRTGFRNSGEVYGGGTYRITNGHYEGRFPTSVLPVFNAPQGIHATRKPIGTCEWLIKTFSNENDIVLDFTCGSGTTLQSCINTNRRYIGVEKNTQIFNKCMELLGGR